MAMAEIYRRLARRLNSIPQGFGDIEEGGMALLTKLFAPEEAVLACVMRLNHETAAVIAARAGMSPKIAYRVLNNMYRKGLIGGIVDNDQIMFGLIPWAVGIYEYQLSHMDVEMAQLHDQAWRAGHGGGTVTHAMPFPMRVVPVNQAIPIDLHVATYNQIMKILEGSVAWSVRDCICRYGQKLLGKACNRPLDVCLIIAPPGGSIDMRMEPTLITLEDARQILYRSEQAGLVHMIGNHSVDHTYICNCCGCCCNILASVTQFDVPAAAVSSDFYAVVDTEPCIGCEECVQRCPLKALSVPDHVCMVNYDRCVGCGLCTQTCPTGALRLARRSEGEIPPPPHNLREWMMQRVQQRELEIEDIWGEGKIFPYTMTME